MLCTNWFSNENYSYFEDHMFMSNYHVRALIFSKLSCNGTDFLNLSYQCNKVVNTVCTPLFMALSAGSLKCVKLLIKVWSINLMSNWNLLDAWYDYWDELSFPNLVLPHFFLDIWALCMWINENHRINTCP